MLNIFVFNIKISQKPKASVFHFKNIQRGIDTFILLTNNSNIKLLNKVLVSEQWQLVVIYNSNVNFASKQRN